MAPLLVYSGLTVAVCLQTAKSKLHMVENGKASFPAGT